ncbi:MAG: GTP-binding protein [Ruminococcaceae bacterium]|nr:GTP-binding protein [Oscillospiraceae bacterium]
MKNKVIGILAHVDAGKTTLSEALLYTTGKIRKLGRVDKRDTFLDTHELERERGITIFSKQAIMETRENRITLLDTPGHIDFSAEAERTLSVIDYAILVISGSEGVQAHTETLWHLLERYSVPTFIFITKMDMPYCSKKAAMDDLTMNLDPSCVDFSDEDAFEHIAMRDEELLEKYLSDGDISDGDIGRLIYERKLFPCFFGSGLKLEGIEALIEAIDRYTLEKEYPEEFSARVYKIGHDKNGTKLTYLKVTGGKLDVRQTILYRAPGEEEETEEKITAIRLYSGIKFDTAENVGAGEVCAVTGLTKTFTGQALGAGGTDSEPYLEPVLNYRVLLPDDVDPRTFMQKLKTIEEEEPLLRITYNERFGDIHAQLMGEVQCEVITSLVKDRTGADITLDDGRIMYKETITGIAEGVGHFEPLRHYSEVHLILEPLERGKGVIFDTIADEDHLEKNWQRLILTHLEEKQHTGTLTGSPITDMKITVVSGKAHIKHTQSGDFRESTYRAVRNGLMQLREMGKCVLLEPYYIFRLELPGECVGRAISDIIAKHGTFDEHETVPGTSVLTGRAPVACISDYAKEVASYTRGRGKFSCRVEGYFPCHNADKVIESYCYDPVSDVANTADSVFCSHGAGFIVPWDKVTEYMHLEASLKPDKTEDDEIIVKPKVIKKNIDAEEKELQAIMEREFGPAKHRVYDRTEIKPSSSSREKEEKAKKEKSLLYIIDGYNVIHAWDELAYLAETDLENARKHLCDILSNYRAFTKKEMIVVFDAYNVKGAVERKYEQNGLKIVYTKEGELADVYIGKLLGEIGKNYFVRAVTSDGLIQLRAVASGILRMSAREFREEVLAADHEIKEILDKLNRK